MNKIKIATFDKEKFIELVNYITSGEYDKKIRNAQSKPIQFFQTKEWYKNNKQFCLDPVMSEDEYNKMFNEGE